MLFDLILLVTWFGAAFAIWNWAEKWGKDPWPYFFSSVFATPILPALVLLFQGRALKQETEQNSAEGM